MNELSYGWYSFILCDCNTKWLRPYFQKPRTQSPSHRALSTLLQLKSISLPLLTFALGGSLVLDMCDCADGHSVSVSEAVDMVRALLERDKNSHFPTSICGSQFPFNIRFSSSNRGPLILLQKWTIFSLPFILRTIPLEF